MLTGVPREHGDEPSTLGRWPIAHGNAWRARMRCAALRVPREYGDEPLKKINQCGTS